MRELFKKTAMSIILSSIVAFIIGLIMVVAPGISLRTIGIVVGIYIIVHGVALIALPFVSRIIYNPFFGIVSGLLSIILGIILLAMPNILSTIFAIALGIWIILSSVDIISMAIVSRKEYSSWGLLLLLGIIDLVCGVIILFNPFASSISIVVLGGIIIMVHSIINIADMIVIKKNVKDIAKAIKSSFKEPKKLNNNQFSG